MNEPIKLNMINIYQSYYYLLQTPRLLRVAGTDSIAVDCGEQVDSEHGRLSVGFEITYSHVVPLTEASHSSTVE